MGPALFLSPLVLLTSGLEQLAVVKKGLVGQLGLVLELDPVVGLMVLHHTLEDLNL